MPRFIFMLLAVAAFPAFVHADAPSYLLEVMPVLTKAGCNQGSCHGKGTGQNGFKLSLRGYAPEDDYRQLTQDSASRRIDPTKPAGSLLLTKPLGETPHEGGKIFSITSREYSTLLAWIEAGAPGPLIKEKTIRSLALSPTDKTLSPNSKQQLTATATFSDGTTADVTWLTKFDSNDAGVARVTANGDVTTLRAGATAIRAAFLTEVAVANIVVPGETAIRSEKFSKNTHPIDVAVQGKLRELNIEPSPRSSDEAFLRRVTLDTIGTLPTPAELAAFLVDASPEKRTKWIDQLLTRPEFTDQWTLFLSDLLQNRKERDHDVRGVKGVRDFHAWIREHVAKNTPWDELARQVLTATGDTRLSPQLGYFVVTVGEHREVEKSEAAESVAQAFMGIRIGCARCHNHPLERYTQDDFFHFSAFFTRIKLERKESKQGPSKLVVSHHDTNQNKKPVTVNHPRTGKQLPPQTLDRNAIAVSDDPRVALAAWITDPKNENFSGSMVNRLWKHFHGTGIVEPVDDLRATNPPSNPALWKVLKESLVASKFDLRATIRFILTSETYQASSATTPSNRTDTRFFSHYSARRLSAEVLLDALTSVTGVPEKFDGYPMGVRAIQVPDPASHSSFLKMFGSSERVSACACERTGDVTLPQLLSLQNGEQLLGKVTDKAGALAILLKNETDDSKLVTQLYRLALVRSPSEKEKQTVQQLLKGDGTREEKFRDLLWALLNSKEFAFNH